MFNSLQMPLIYNVELHAPNYFNNGYLRFFNDGRIDGILTDNYFSIMYANFSSEPDNIFIILILNENNKSSIYKFENTLSLYEFLEKSEHIAYSSIQDFVSLKILEPISDKNIMVQISSIIDKAHIVASS